MSSRDLVFPSDSVGAGFDARTAAPCLRWSSVGSVAVLVGGASSVGAEEGTPTLGPTVLTQLARSVDAGDRASAATATQFDETSTHACAASERTRTASCRGTASAPRGTADALDALAVGGVVTEASAALLDVERRAPSAGAPVVPERNTEPPRYFSRRAGLACSYASLRPRPRGVVQHIDARGGGTMLELQGEVVRPTVTPARESSR